MPRLRKFALALIAISLCGGVMFLLARTAAGATLEQQRQMAERLDAIYHRDQTDATIREQYLTALNNYALALADAEQWLDAITQLRRAIRIARKDQRLVSNLANIYVRYAQQLTQTRRTRQAEHALHDALQYAPDHVASLVLLGRVYYDSQRLRKAEQTWSKAKTLDPSFPGLQEHLSRLGDERQVEESFGRIPQAHFNIRFSKELPAKAEVDLREALREAYRAIGRELGHYPKQRITVLLYTEAEFRQIQGDTPEWVGGVYDGKIRLPLMSSTRNPLFRQVVSHEYTHAMVRELAGGHCPSWLNEGLAEYQGNKHMQRGHTFLKPFIQSGQRIPLRELEHSFLRMSSAEHAAVAYEYAGSLVEYLVDRYGFWRFKRLLKSLGEGTPFEAAFKAEFRLRFPEQLEERWLEWIVRRWRVSR